MLKQLVEKNPFFQSPIDLNHSTRLCALRIEMENYFPHTYHGLSMDRTSIGTGLFNTKPSVWLNRGN